MVESAKSGAPGAEGQPPARVLPTRAAKLSQPAVPRTQLQKDMEDVAVEVFST